MKIIIVKGSEIPEKLRNVNPPVEKLSLKGNVELLNMPAVAIVGSRKFTAYGKQAAEKFARAGAEAGLVVISGLALGIDSIAHRAALAVGGKTIAVLPSGLENIYPATHHGLAQQILDNGGLLVSEYSSKSKPMIYHFEQRNRIVSGLSECVIVAEGAERSGSMITARLALEQGKQLFAVPGPITSSSYRGNHNLINVGTELLQDSNQILEFMNVTGDNKPKKSAANSEQAAILEQIDNGISDGDELLQKSGLSADIFAQTLTMMELDGIIHALGGNHWSRK
ncbi:DNA-processing protein DprA [Candidatus Saccharibacteria bacterium]|jgi:DNA processing protein|nr:DNA-processing protein DprA [Candidatus Saccharibacteria bacterium]